MPAPSIGFYCYPWNVHEPGVLLGELEGAGLSHVTVAAAYHAGKFIQPRDPVRRVYFPEDGTVYFRSKADHYGRLQPQMATLTQRRDVLAALCDADRLPVRAWTVLNHNSRLGWKHPEAVVRNAWGDAYYYSLCPSNPDVRAYDVALCADLAGRYALDSLLLESPGWLTYDHGYHHEFAQLDCSAELNELLGLCFCSACVDGAQAAGIDAEALRHAVRTRADALLSGDEREAERPGLDLGAYRAWRCSVVSSLCAQIRAAVRPEVRVRIISTCQRPHATCHLEGGDLKGMDAASDGLELPIYQPSAAAAEQDLKSVVAQGIAPERLSVILRPGLPDMTSEAQLTDTLARVAACGVGDVSFYNYGLLPAREFGWALRAARAFHEGHGNA